MNTGDVMPDVPTIAAEPEPPPRKPPALAEKASDLEALRGAVVDAAAVSAGLWISYLFALFYLLVAAGGVTHRDLFFASPIRLPFLGVDLPLEGFFWLGPALFLIVHAYVLLHFVLLAGKVRVFDAELLAQVDDADVRTRLRRQLPSNIFVQFLAGPVEAREGVVGFLLRLIAWISLVVGPVALLLFFQLQFLPYHHEGITWWQRIAVAIDLVLLWTLWPAVGGRRTVRRSWPRMGLDTMGIMAALTLVALPLSFVVATFPGEGVEWLLPRVPLRKQLVDGAVDLEARRPTSVWLNRLVLPGLDVLAHLKIDGEAKLAGLTETVSLRKRNLEGAVLIGAVMTKADLTGAFLKNAQLTGAKLQEARLNGAQMERAVLNGADLRNAELEKAHLQSASLVNAQLQGAKLVNAQLEGASLWSARLAGADLTEAQMLGASLDHSDLRGAFLVLTQLQGASLRNSDLRGARLAGASLDAADLEQADLQTANLDSARLDGAVLRQARLQGASFVGSSVWRADIAGAAETDMRVSGNAGESGNACFGTNKTRCDRSIERWNSLNELARRSIPPGRLHERIRVARLSRLDPSKPLEGEEAMATRWAGLQLASPSPDAYEEEIAVQWRHLGCATDGAPFVVLGLIRAMTEGTTSPFAPGSPYQSRLTSNLLSETCAGTRRLPDASREALQRLRDHSPRSP